MTERIPPNNLEAEQSLLGALLIDQEAIIRVADILERGDLYAKKHAIIYSAILDLYTRNEPIDVLSVSNRIEELGSMDLVGGRGYLTTLASVVPTSSHVVTYANIITRKALLRKLITAGGKITELAFSQEDEVEDILDKAEHEIFAVSEVSRRETFVPIKSILGEAFERIDEIHHHKGGLRGLSSGFPSLDNHLAGFQKSDLIVLAARPSVGKTSLALDFARSAAAKHKVPVAIFSLEMSKEILVDRLLCSQARVDLWKMRTGRLAEEDFPRLGDAMGLLSEVPLYIDDSGTLNIMEIRTKARRLMMENGLGMVVIDYLQLMESIRHTEGRVQEISEISRGLKQIARELNIPVVALSQLSRQVESRSPAIPRLSDLRESGSIEQDADVVLFIYRKSQDSNFRDIDPNEKNIAKILIAKHRNGPTGEVDLYFDERFASFSELAKPELFPGAAREVIPDVQF